MNYQELIESIDKHSGFSGEVFNSIVWAHENAPDIHAFDDIGVIKRIIDIALADPKAWYIYDMNGERVHIGDEIIDGDGCKEKVTELGDGYVYTDEEVYRSANIKKVIPDTREKIIEDMIAEGLSREAAEEYMSRIKAVEE